MPTKRLAGAIAPVAASSSEFLAEVRQQEALLRTGALQSAIFNSANFSSIATDARGVIQIFNVGAARMLGYAAIDVMNTTTPADISEPEELIARARMLSAEFSVPIAPGFEALVFKASRGIEDIYELTYVRKDGSRFPAVVSVTALRDTHDAIIGYLLISTDNSARKQSEEARRASEARYRALFECAPDGIIIADPGSHCLDANVSMCRMLGYRHDELVGMHGSSYVTEKEPRRIGVSLDEADGNAKYESEWQFRRKDGSTFEAEVIMALMPDGNRLGMVRDISARKQEEAELLKAGALQSAIFNSANFSSIATDARGVIQIFNVGAERMLGFSAADVVNKITPADISDPLEVVARAAVLSIELGTTIKPGFEALVFKASRGIEDIYELSYIRKDGSRFPAVVSVTALRDAHATIIGYLLIGTDNTARKQLADELVQHRNHLEELVFSRTAELAESRDAAEAASRAKSFFLANMSHELRTPMNGIMGMTDLALRHATDPKQIDWLSKGAQAARHLLAIINDILDISRIEADQLTLEEKTFSLKRAIDESLRILDDQAHAKGLRLSRDISPSLPDLLCGDALRLKQVMLNLVGNAIKFSERGQIIVRALAEDDRDNRLLLRIEVADEGIGMSAEQQTRLFRAFSQVDDSSTRKYGGSGLGLVISKRLAKLMGGDVGVTSEPGFGSTFWMTARLRRAVDAPVNASSHAEPLREILAMRFHGVRVLLAEDDPASQEVARRLLDEAGLMLDVVGNGLEAVERVSTANYALILMDMKMPLMDGLEATLAIRKMPGLSTIPILAMTANAFAEDRERCLAAGMNGHIGKPVEPFVLYSTLLQWLLRDSNPPRG
jgi:PAS domain S-box-containing protein